MWEYKVVAAPTQPARRREAGVKELTERFAFSIEARINELAAQGWEYQRSDVLPCEERSGLTGRSQSFQTVLIFRRPRAEPEPLAVAAPEPDPAPEPAPAPEETASDESDGEGVDSPDDPRA